ncbi:hypothetical protein [Sphingorhabdus sp.]|uniref:hypothetical protein n=1 Tax=Sphingorhabdus sp. TaxID=1902408 RepID=UPI0033424717
MPTLINKHSETTGAVPAITELLVGEIAVNTADKKWFTKTTAGGIVCLNQLTVIDGGEISGFVELITSTGQNLADASGNIIGFR